MRPPAIWSRHRFICVGQTSPANTRVKDIHTSRWVPDVRGISGMGLGTTGWWYWAYARRSMEGVDRAPIL